MYNQDDKDTQIMFFWDMMLYKMTDIYIQGVPLRTKPGSSLIILLLRRILQRNIMMHGSTNIKFRRPVSNS